MLELGMQSIKSQHDKAAKRIVPPYSLASPYSLRHEHEPEPTRLIMMQRAVSGGHQGSSPKGENRALIRWCELPTQVQASAEADSHMDTEPHVRATWIHVECP